MKDFVIVLSGGVSNAVFYPGQVVSGSVKCENSAPKTFKEVKIRFEGRVDVSLPGANSISRSLNSDNILKTSKTYFNDSVTLWTKSQFYQGVGEDQLFPAGVQTLPFSFQIPQNLPPSFSGIWGTIKYFLEAKIYKEGKFKQDSVITCPVTIANAVVVDTRPSQVALETQSTPSGMLCCVSNPIVMTVSIPKKGYCLHNEAIPVRVHIENGSNRGINNIEVYVDKRIMFNTGRSNQTQTCKQNRVFRNRPILRHSSGDFEATVLADSNSPPTLINCEFIKIDYFVCVMCMVNRHPNMFLEIPIILGNAVNTTQPHPPQAPPTHQMTRMDSIQYQLPQQQPSYISAPPPPQPAHLPRMDSTSVPYSTDTYPYQPQPYMESAPPPQPYPVNMPLEPQDPNPPPYPSAPPLEDSSYVSASAPPPPSGPQEDRNEGHIENGTMVTVGKHTFKYMAFTG